MVSIEDVSKWKGGGVKFGQNYQWTADMGEGQAWGGGVKNPEKLPTSFMDNPLLDTL